MSKSKPQPIATWKAGRFTVEYWGSEFCRGTLIYGPDVFETADGGIHIPPNATGDELRLISQALSTIADIKGEHTAAKKLKPEPTIELSSDAVGHRIKGIFPTPPKPRPKRKSWP